MNNLQRYCDSAEFRMVQEKGFLRVEDGMPTISPNNIGMPAGILSSVSPDIVENILAYRAGDEALGGRKMLIDWAKDKTFIPFVERTGQSTPYADYDDAIASGLNLNFGEVGHYRFSTALHIGELESAQLAEAKIDANQYYLSAAMEALMIELNRTLFYGYVQNQGANPQFLVYGLLNHPALNAYETAPKQISAMSFQEVVAFLTTAISKLRSQSGANLQKGSKVRIIIASSAFDALTLKFTDLGVDAVTAIINKFKDLGIEISLTPALELDNANANQNVIYFIMENNLGGVSDTTTAGYSEIGRLSNIVYGTTFRQQKVSAGTTGAVIYKPAYIVRYTNI